MTDFSGITTLVFDLGGVLVNLDKERCVNNFKKLGVNVIDELLSTTVQQGFILQFEEGNLSVHDFREKIRTFTTKTISDKEIDDAWNSFLVDIPAEKLEVLAKLKKKFRILMLSNTNTLSYNHTIDTMINVNGHTVNDYFDTCYVSYKMQLSKPGKAIFNALLEKENLKPEECFFLDDGVHNVKTAEELGLRTYYVKSHEDWRPLFDSVI